MLLVLDFDLVVNNLIDLSGARGTAVPKSCNLTSYLNNICSISIHFILVYSMAWVHGPGPYKCSNLDLVQRGFHGCLASPCFVLTR